jgi:hypothetical protein
MRREERPRAWRVVRLVGARAVLHHANRHLTRLEFHHTAYRLDIIREFEIHPV